MEYKASTFGNTTGIKVDLDKSSATPTYSISFGKGFNFKLDQKEANLLLNELLALLQPKQSTANPNQVGAMKTGAMKTGANKGVPQKP